VRDKIPIPPEGHVIYKPKNRRIGKEETQYSMRVCPYCDVAEGYSNVPVFYTHKPAQEFYESFGDGYTEFCREFEGEMIKCHWSRMDGWKCSNCGKVTLHDWDCGYDENHKYHDNNNYWKPSDKWGSTSLSMWM